MEGLTSHRRIAAVYATAVLLVLAIGLVSWAVRIPTADLTRDPASVAHIAPYVGLLSNLGVVLWSAAAALSLFAGLTLKQREPELARFLVGASLLSTLLLLDDLFVLHETLEYYTRAGTELLPVVAYGGFAFALVTRHRALITTRTPVLLLVVAAAAFAISTLVDAALGGFVPGLYLVEDGSKFLGIVSWGTYLGVTAYASLAPSPNSILQATDMRNLTPHGAERGPVSVSIWSGTEQSAPSGPVPARHIARS